MAKKSKKYLEAAKKIDSSKAYPGWTNAKDAFLYGGVLFLLSAISAVVIGYPLGVFFGI